MTANLTKLLAFALFAGLALSGSAADAQYTLRTFRYSPQATPYTVQPRQVAPPAQQWRPMTRGPSHAMTRTQPEPTPAPAERGRIACGITDNGGYAPGTIELRQGGAVLASGDCTVPLELPVGTYDATLTLTSALDRPQQTVRVTVTRDGLATARAAFETSILEVRFTANGQHAPGIAYVKRDGRVVGTLGSGVSGRVSSGSYEVLARYRTTDQVLQVDLAPGQRRALRAAF